MVTGGVVSRAITHPRLGDLYFEAIHLRMPQFPELRIILHNPRPTAETGIDTEKITRAAFQEVSLTA